MLYSVGRPIVLAICNLMHTQLRIHLWAYIIYRVSRDTFISKLISFTFNLYLTLLTCKPDVYFLSIFFQLFCVWVCNHRVSFLSQGVRFDPDLPQTLRLEFAKTNTKMAKPKQQQQQQQQQQQSSIMASTAPTLQQYILPTLINPVSARKSSQPTLSSCTVAI